MQHVTDPAPAYSSHQLWIMTGMALLVTTLYFVMKVLVTTLYFVMKVLVTTLYFVMKVPGGASAGGGVKI